MKRLSSSLLGLTCSLCCAAAFILVVGADVSVAAYKTYIIALDGMRAEYIGASYSGGAHDDDDITPNLTWLKSQGGSYGVWTVMPAFTATNHVAIIASANAGKSGILGAGGGYVGMDPTDSTMAGTTYTHQDLHDRGVTTLFNAAKDAGAGKTAIIAGKTWVGDIFYDDNNTGCDYKIYPNSGHGLSYITQSSYTGYIWGGPYHLPGDATLARVFIPPPGSCVLPQYCDTIGGSVNTDVFPSDAWIIDNAITVVDSMDPDLLYILMANMDEVGHANGALFDGSVSNLHRLRNPDAVRDQVWITDSLVGVFINHLQSITDPNASSRFDNSIIVITADHAMSSMKKGDKAIDIRQVLADNGYPMRLKDEHVNLSYNPNGVYDYCVTEGPTAYFYEIDPDTFQSMENFLRYNVPPVDAQNPVKAVYSEEAMKAMFGGPPTGTSHLLWPDMIVVFKQHMCAYLYGDEIKEGVNAMHIEVDVPTSFKDLFSDTLLTVKSIPGEHGCHQERHVPCILVGGGVKKGMENVTLPLTVGSGFMGEVDPQGGELLSGTAFWHVTGIAPAICELNNWSIPPSFSGGSILSSLPFFVVESDWINGEPELGSFSAEMFGTSDLSGSGGWFYIGSDEFAGDGFSVFWDPDLFPKGDYLLKMVQFPMGSEQYAHIFSAPPGMGQVIFNDNFYGGRMDKWMVNLSDATFGPDSLNYKSSPYSVRMVSQGEGYAWARTPDLEVDTTQDFTVGTYFMIPDENNHWFVVLDNNWISLVIDYFADLKAWQGSHGGTLPIAELNPGQWYWIRADVHPMDANYDIYLDGVYMATANFLQDPPGSVKPYFRMGDVLNGAYDHGEAYWDGIFVFGKRAEAPFISGDANGDGAVDVADVMYLINYLFLDGSAPEPLEAGDANSDGHVNIGDVAYLINYLFLGGSPPSR